MLLEMKTKINPLTFEGKLQQKDMIMCSMIEKIYRNAL
jgi:hypothetical protein